MTREELVALEGARRWERAFRQAMERAGKTPAEAMKSVRQAAEGDRLADAVAVARGHVPRVFYPELRKPRVYTVAALRVAAAMVER